MVPVTYHGTSYDRGIRLFCNIKVTSFFFVFKECCVKKNLSNTGRNYLKCLKMFNACVVLNVECCRDNLLEGENPIAVWVIDCKDAKGDDSCPKSRYHGNLDLTSLVLYVRTLMVPRVVSTLHLTSQ